MKMHIEFNYTKLQVSITVIGVLLILISIFAGPLGLSAGAGVGYGQIFLSASGLIFIASAFFKKKALDFYKTIAILLLNTFVIFAILEFGALILVKFTGTTNLTQESERERTQRISIEETGLTFPTQKYFPFVGWRSAPLALHDMNIDSAGVRLTCGIPDTFITREVFLFGGSAMWGWMVPDSSTIPSYIQGYFNTSVDYPVAVRNFAQNGYTSTQDLMELILRLQAGETPQTVIFYSGFNDVLSAYENGRSGLLIGNSTIVDRLDRRGERRISVNPSLQLLMKSNTYILLSNLFFKGTVVESHQTTALVPANRCFDDPEFELSLLADEICNDYLGNYRIVEALAKEFDFEFYFIVQPVLSELGKNLSSEEEITLGLEDENLLELVSLTYAGIGERQVDYPHMYMDMSVFNSVEETIYADMCHINGAGNRLIAQYIVEQVF